MGFAIAHAAALRGADVTLIAGPVTLPTPACVKRIDVESAQDMYEQVMLIAPSQDIFFIGCAAVADYRAKLIAAEKIIKKQGDEVTITMVKNPDIVASVGKMVEHRPFVVGFAAETQNVEEYARKKNENKSSSI
ncbi:DNA / pantothenate metabolism flavoprotein [Proteus penneri ATCC 35198]|nr:DNA / pantothenate metabolism flavoprotein [Proteus penneri ATCC 35198]